MRTASKKRFNLVIEEDLWNRIQEAPSTVATTTTDFIRVAVELKLRLDSLDKDSKIIIREKDGSERELWIL
jgi:mRNA-degrading endonuclease toxin of MazEF toxin-antitoxin module